MFLYKALCFLTLHSVFSNEGTSYTTLTRSSRVQQVYEKSIPQKTLQSTPYKTAEDALKHAGSLVLIQHGTEGKGYQFHLRGFDAQHGADFAVSLEGIPLNEWSHVHAQGYVDLGFIIPETVQEVRVQKGPYDIDEGAFGMAGSAQYRLGVPVGVRGMHALGSTQRHRSVVTYAPSSSDGTSFVAAEAMQDQGFGQHRSSRKWALLGKGLLWESPGWGTAWAMSSLHSARFDMAGVLRNQDMLEGRYGFYNSTGFGEKGTSQRALFAINHTLRARGVVFETLAYAQMRFFNAYENPTGFLEDPVNGDMRLQEHRSTMGGIRHTMQAREKRVWQWQTSLGMHADAVDQTQKHLNTEHRVLGTTYAQKATQQRWYAALNTVFHPCKGCSIQTGVRADVGWVNANGTHFFAQALPKTTLHYTHSKKWKAFVRYGQAFRPYEARVWSRKEASGKVLSDEYNPVDASRTVFNHALDIGFHVPWGTWIHSTLTGFATWVQNESVYDHVSGTNIYLNPTRRVGFEWDVHVQPTQRWSVHTNLTYADARFTASHRPIPFVSPWVLYVRTGYEHPKGWYAGMRVLYASSEPLPHGARGSAYSSADLTVAYTFKNITLRLDIDNAFAQKRYEGEYHFASRISQQDPSNPLPSLHYTAGAPWTACVSMGFKID